MTESPTDVLQRLSLPLAVARGLPSTWYTDPEHFRVEQRALLRYAWVAVAFDHAIPPASAHPIEFAGAGVALVRDSAGTLRAFHNVCAFDACPVVLQPAVAITELVGPYHGWTWTLDGTLQRAPYVHGLPECTPAELAALDGDLKPVRLAIWNDLVFITVGHESGDFDSWIAPVDAALGGADLTPMAPARTIDGRPVTTTSEVAGNWKIVVENDVELLHEPFVHEFYATHPEISPKVDASGTLTVRLVAHERLYGFAAPTGMYFDDELLASTPLFEAGGQPLPEFHIYDLYPNVALGVAANHVVLSIIRPLGPAATRIDSTYYVHESVAADPEIGELVTELTEAWEIAREEDNVVVEATQFGRGSSAIGPTPYAPLWFEVLRAFHARIATDLARDSCTT